MKQNSTSKCFLLEKGKCSNFKVIFLDMYILQIRPFAIRRPRKVGICFSEFFQDRKKLLEKVGEEEGEKKHFWRRGLRAGPGMQTQSPNLHVSLSRTRSSHEWAHRGDKYSFNRPARPPIHISRHWQNHTFIGDNDCELILLILQYIKQMKLYLWENEHRRMEGGGGGGGEQ